MNTMVEKVRGLVRPIVTFLVVLALVIIVCFLVFKFSDMDMANRVIIGFMTLVGTISGFWFGSRNGRGVTGGTGGSSGTTGQ